MLDRGRPDRTGRISELEFKTFSGDVCAGIMRHVAARRVTALPALALRLADS